MRKRITAAGLTLLFAILFPLFASAGDSALPTWPVFNDVALPAWLEFSEELDIQVRAIPDVSSTQVAADAAIVVEASTGRVLFEQDADERLPIASTTKIMTAMITLEQPDLDAQFVVDPTAIKVEGSSMGLQEGDQVTLRALATGMLLASGNDAAGAAAVRVSGSVPAFVAAMNQRAAVLGMTNTSFETPSGLDGESHYSSARDMATLTRAALANTEFAAICSEYRVRTSYGNPPYDRWLTNHNKLLNYYEGAIGVKTGFTKKAGRCLVSAAERDGVTLICVTLNCPSDWEVHQTLFDRYFGKIQIEDLAKSAPEVMVPVTGGMELTVEAVTYEKAQVPVPTEGSEIEYRVGAPQFLYAPVRQGQNIGYVDIFLDGEPVRRLTLIAQQDIQLKHEYVEEYSLLDWLAGLFG